LYTFVTESLKVVELKEGNPGKIIVLS